MVEQIKEFITWLIENCEDGERITQRKYEQGTSYAVRHEDIVRNLRRFYEPTEKCLYKIGDLTLNGRYWTDPIMILRKVSWAMNDLYYYRDYLPVENTPRLGLGFYQERVIRPMICEGMLKHNPNWKKWNKKQLWRFYKFHKGGIGESLNASSYKAELLVGVEEIINEHYKAVTREFLLGDLLN